MYKEYIVSDSKLFLSSIYMTFRILSDKMSSTWCSMMAVLPVAILFCLVLPTVSADRCREKEKAMIKLMTCTENTSNLSGSNDANVSSVPANFQTTLADTHTTPENMSTMSSTNADMVSSSALADFETSSSSVFTMVWTMVLCPLYHLGLLFVM